MIDRVQTSPLQPEAEQLARLGVDVGYVVPDFFAAIEDSDGEPIDIDAFSGFYGMRAIAGPWSFFGPGTRGTTCITFYPEDGISAGSDTFQGPILTGCEAGAFPATLQFTTDLDGLPAELRDAFPETTGLQLVYDAEHREVVVFVSPAE